MLDILDETSGNVLAVRLSGKHLHTDAHELADIIDARIEKYGAARCLIEIADVEGVELSAVIEGVEFDLHHAHTIERCAIVGHEDWERWLTRILQLFFRNATLRYFSQAERDAAVAWVREGA
jgi:hypothetical protein